MIHYHGTPCGGTKTDAKYFLKNRHALVSFANQQDVGIVMQETSSFILDNGAFTFWRGGKSPNWDKYIEWVSEIGKSPKFDWWLIPDVIDGNEDDNWRLMFNYGRKFPFGVPVFHMHESIYHLQRLIDSYDRIAIGSSGQWPNPGTPSWWNRMNILMKTICNSDGTPKVKLHGLRMLDPKIFTKLPLSSADSCNASRNSCRTNIKGSSRGEKAVTIAKNVEIFTSPNKYTFLKKGLF